jgi:site-specific DNA recombinase
MDAASRSSRSTPPSSSTCSNGTSRWAAFARWRWSCRSATSSSRRETATGRSIGGGFFSRGQVYKILGNPTYVGEIHHHGKVHAGNHPAIIERETWERAQQLLEENKQGQRPTKHARNRSLLADRLVDEEGEPLIATHASKGKVRYRYYVSRALQHDPDADSAAGLRIPAREIEAAVAERVAEALDDPIALTAKAGLTLHSGDLRQTMALARSLAEQVRTKDYQLVRELVNSARQGKRDKDRTIS